MANTFEVCTVRLKSRHDHAGFFNAPSVHYDRYVAEVSSPSGTQIIAQTDEFKTLDTSGANVAEGMQQASTLLREAHHRLLEELFKAGWEVLTTDDFGQAASLKREVGASNVASAPSDLLVQLASLRDQGILTEQEYQAKKAELLRRL